MTTANTINEIEIVIKEFISKYPENQFYDVNVDCESCGHEFVVEWTSGDIKDYIKYIETAEYRPEHNQLNIYTDDSSYLIKPQKNEENTK